MSKRRPGERHLRDIAGGAGGATCLVVADTDAFDVDVNRRMAEIATITQFLEGEPPETWDALVQPRRVVGTTHIHDMTPSMHSNSPLFGGTAVDTLDQSGSAMPELNVVICPTCLATRADAGGYLGAQNRRCDECVAPTTNQRSTGQCH